MKPRSLDPRPQRAPFATHAGAKALRAALLALAVAGPGLAGGCAAAAPQVRVSGEFTPALARVFDDSVDYVENVDGLGGRVAAEFTRQINGLTRNADLIGEARVETVIQGQDQDGSRNYRMTAVITRSIRGALPEENRVQLRVSEGSVGFHTVAGKEERIGAGRFLLFVRWYEGSGGAIQAHWHLTPHSDVMVNRVRTTINEMTGSNPQEVIVRQDQNQ